MAGSQTHAVVAAVDLLKAVAAHLNRAGVHGTDSKFKAVAAAKGYSAAVTAAGKIVLWGNHSSVPHTNGKPIADARDEVACKIMKRSLDLQKGGGE